MTADPFAPDPLPGLRLDGVTISEAIRLQGEARVHYDDDDLRLDVDQGPDEPRRWPSPSRTAIITLWIVGLIAALAIASYAQLLRQRNAELAMDVPPPPPEAAPAVLTTPVPPPAPALSQPAPIAAGVVPSDTDTAVSDQAAAPEAAAPPPPVAKAAAPEEVKPEPRAAEPKAKAKDAEPAKAKSEKAAAKPAGDIERLRHRLDHAYAVAVKAGVPKSVMKAREAEWRVLYAKAKKKSPEAVAELYKTRTTQLDALAKKHRAAAR